MVENMAHKNKMYIGSIFLIVGLTALFLSSVVSSSYTGNFFWNNFGSNNRGDSNSTTSILSNSNVINCLNSFLNFDSYKVNVEVKDLYDSNDNHILNSAQFVTSIERVDGSNIRLSNGAQTKRLAVFVDRNGKNKIFIQNSRTNHYVMYNDRNILFVFDDYYTIKSDTKDLYDSNDIIRINSAQHLILIERTNNANINFYNGNTKSIGIFLDRNSVGSVYMKNKITNHYVVVQNSLNFDLYKIKSEVKDLYDSNDRNVLYSGQPVVLIERSGKKMMLKNCVKTSAIGIANDARVSFLVYLKSNITNHFTEIFY